MSRLNEQQQENIRQVFKQTASIRQTAKQTGHGRKAVRRALGYSMVNAPVSRPRTSKLDPYKAKISYLVKEKRLSVVLILG
jgi:IS30 family transposase